MAARNIFLVLAFLVLGAATGCRSYCERNYPCPPAYAPAPYCPPAPVAYAPAAAPAAFGPGGTVRTGCTCTCP